MIHFSRVPIVCFFQLATWFSISFVQASLMQGTALVKHYSCNISWISHCTMYAQGKSIPVLSYVSDKLHLNGVSLKPSFEQHHTERSLIS